MAYETQVLFKAKILILSKILRKRLRQLAIAGNLRLQKYYCKILHAIRSYHEIILDENGNVLTWNNKFEQLEGYREDEIIGHSFNMFYLPADRQRRLPEELLKKAAANGKSRYFGRFVCKRGNVFWGKLVLTAIKKDDREVLGFVVLCRETKNTKSLG